MGLQRVGQNWATLTHTPASTSHVVLPSPSHLISVCLLTTVWPSWLCPVFSSTLNKCSFSRKASPNFLGKLDLPLYHTTFFFFSFLKGQYFFTVVKYIYFPSGARGTEPACQCRRLMRHGFDPWVGKIPWRRTWKPTLVFLTGESHGERSLVCYSPWGRKESDTTEAP